MSLIYGTRKLILIIKNFYQKKRTIEDNVFYINLFRDITTEKKIKNFFQIFRVKNNLKK